MTGISLRKVSLAKIGSRTSRPQQVDWKLPLDTVVTKAGSLAGDLVWDFSQDNDEIKRSSWTGPVRIGGVVVESTADEKYRPLINALQQAVAARWHYATRDDGLQWRAKRAYDAVGACRLFVQWMAAAGLSEPEEITEEVLLAWRDFVAIDDNGKPRTHRYQRATFDAPLLLWRMRHRTDRTLLSAPAGLHPDDYIEAQDDTTPIPLIPRPVLEHLVGAAYRYVDLYAEDIRSARRYLESLGQAWADERSVPVPRWGEPSYKRMEVYIGKRFGWDSAEAQKHMLVPAPWNPDGKFLKDHETGEAWIPAIRSRRHQQVLENSLRTASYILIAFLTGGRNTEMNKLRTDCAKWRDSGIAGGMDGYIRGVVTKHRGEGQEVEWGVPPIAIKAAGLLLDMSASWREKTGTDRLFVTQTGKKLDDRLMNVDLKVFLERIGAPYVGGEPFRITTHQLRVALAQWLGAEPMGELAGAFHFKQLNTAAFRGYLREDPQFLSLFEAFGMQAHTDHLEMLLQEPVVGGRKGSELMASRTPEEQARLEQNVRVLNLAQVGRNAPTERVMKKLRKARPVYLTAFSTCVFDANAAECLKGVPPEQRSKPQTHRCSPLSCANSAITRLQIPTYLEDCEAYALMQKDPASSPSQVQLAHEEKTRLMSVIRPHVPILQAELANAVAALDGTDAREATTVALKQRRDHLDNLLVRMSALGMNMQKDA